MMAFFVSLTTFLVILLAKLMVDCPLIGTVRPLLLAVDLFVVGMMIDLKELLLWIIE